MVNAAIICLWGFIFEEQHNPEIYFRRDRPFQNIRKKNNQLYGIISIFYTIFCLSFRLSMIHGLCNPLPHTKNSTRIIKVPLLLHLLITSEATTCVHLTITGIAKTGNFTGNKMQIPYYNPSKACP